MFLINSQFHYVYRHLSIDKLFRIKLIRFAALLLLICLSPKLMFSYPDGVTGRTLKTVTTGCGSCHNSSASSSVIVAINGPSTLQTNQTAAYTVTVSDVSGTTGGVDIAVSAGTLVPVSTFLKSLSGELTNNQKTSVPSTYQFNYTTPATGGDITMYATGKGSGFNSWNWAPNKIVTVTSTTGVRNDTKIPTQFRVEQNYPNPFNPVTNFKFSVASTSIVNLKIFNTLGEEVAVLLNEQRTPGEYSVSWNASSLSSGVYIYQFTAGEFKAVKKITLIR
jgi:hypothetical protein